MIYRTLKLCPSLSHHSPPDLKIAMCHGSRKTPRLLGPQLTSLHLGLCEDWVPQNYIWFISSSLLKLLIVHSYQFFTHTHTNMRFLHVSSRYHHINSITMTSPLLLKLISPHFIHLVLQLTSGKTTKQYQTSPNIFKHQKQSQPTAFSKGIQAA